MIAIAGAAIFILAIVLFKNLSSSLDSDLFRLVAGLMIFGSAIWVLRRLSTWVNEGQLGVRSMEPSSDWQSYSESDFVDAARMASKRRDCSFEEAVAFLKKFPEEISVNLRYHYQETSRDRLP